MYVSYCFIILYLSFVVFDLWLSILYIGNLMGLFFRLAGGLGCCGYWDCCSVSGFEGLSEILGSSVLLSEMCFS